MLSGPSKCREFLRDERQLARGMFSVTYEMVVVRDGFPGEVRSTNRFQKNQRRCKGSDAVSTRDRHNLLLTTLISVRNR